MVIEILGENLSDCYRRLIINDLRRQMGYDESSYFDPLSEDEVAGLLSRASILALEEDPGANELAYEIATRILVNMRGAGSGLVDIVSFILSRLGNFPAKSLVDSYGDMATKSVPISIQLEALSRKMGNSVEISEGNTYLLTDFQYKLYNRIKEYRAVSFSAPTSAGKSYLLGLDLVRRINKKGRKSIVFIVPTRALIRQVIRDVNKVLSSFGKNLPVVCLPELFNDEQYKEGVIYVLTQERLVNLLGGDHGEPLITALIVDEAQEIQSGSRGIVLQSAIKQVVNMFPEADVVFSSPLRSNPGYLLELFNQRSEGIFFVEENSPVSQNLIHLRSVKSKPRELSASINASVGFIDLGAFSIPFKLRGNKPKMLAELAYNFTSKNASSIVYANGPREAEKIAESLAELNTESSNISKRLRDLIDYIRSDIHPKHPLIGLLGRGCAFHYGHLPHLVRAEIEDLVREGEIKFLTCTSTLLQGVNLPVKNIFIWKPLRGNLAPMTKGDFWNLAGRAGRLTKEFHGNVWCIEVDDWEINPFEGDRRVEMISALDSTLLDKSEAVLAAALEKNRASEVKGVGDIDHAFSVSFNDAIEGKFLLSGNSVSEKNRSTLSELDRINQSLIDDYRRISPEVFRRNVGVSAHRINELRSYFESNSEQIEIFLPPFPKKAGAYEVILNIFRVIDKIFLKKENEQYRYYCFLAFRWINGSSLKDLIHARLERLEESITPELVAKEVEGLLGDIENVIRYRYVKYLRVYADVLHDFLRQTDRVHLSSQISPLHLYLENGAWQKTTMNLMSLGISRATAIILQRGLKLGSDRSREECLEIIRSREFLTLVAPEVCRREVSQLLNLS